MNLLLSGQLPHPRINTTTAAAAAAAAAVRPVKIYNTRFVSFSLLTIRTLQIGTEKFREGLAPHITQRAVAKF